MGLGGWRALRSSLRAGQVPRPARTARRGDPEPAAIQPGARREAAVGGRGGRSDRAAAGGEGRGGGGGTQEGGGGGESPCMKGSHARVPRAAKCLSRYLKLRNAARASRAPLEARVLRWKLLNDTGSLDTPRESRAARGRFPRAAGVSYGVSEAQVWRGAFQRRIRRSSEVPGF